MLAAAAAAYGVAERDATDPDGRGNVAFAVMGGNLTVLPERAATGDKQGLGGGCLTAAAERLLGSGGGGGGDGAMLGDDIGIVHCGSLLLAIFSTKLVCLFNTKQT